MSKDTVKLYVCVGSHCRKKRLAPETLSALRDYGSLKLVRCQKICSAPVVGVDHGDGPRWFKRMRSEKLAKALLKFVSTERLKKRLRAQEHKGRAGRLRT